MLIAGKILARVLLNRLNEHLDSQGFYHKASVDSGKTEEQQSFKKNARNRMCAKATEIFSAKNIRILYIESAKTVNKMTLNKLIKLMTL